ncbi:MAG: HD family phosphohydrolase [Bacillota bacterium]
MWQQIRDHIQRFTEQGRWKNSRLRKFFWGVLFFALLTLILVDQTIPNRLNVRPGELAPQDYRAPREFINRVATEQKRQAAAASVSTQYRKDLQVLARAEEDIQAAFREVALVRTMTGQDLKAKVQELADRVKLRAIPTETYSSVLTADESLLVAAREAAIRLARAALSGNLAEKDVPRVKEQIDREEAPFTLEIKDPGVEGFVKELVKSRIQPNYVADEAETARVRQLAAQAEEPVMWKKNQLIIRANEPVTEEQYEALKELGVIGEEADYRSWVGTGLLAAVLVGLVGLYLTQYRPDILERDSKLLLLGLIGTLTLLLAMLMNLFADRLGSGAAYLMPIAFNSMLVTILLDPKLALLQSVIISLLTGLFSPVDQLNHAIVSAVGAVVGVYAVSRVESRNDIYRAGFFVGATMAATVFAFYLMRSAPLLDWRLWRDVGIGGANGLLVAVLVTGALPMFENLFGVVTPLKLLELSNPNHPLLKKLMVEAPGSYHHTILVANLCEAAAEAIGADQVLARVGAYYHDIGKTKRPAFFVENQFGGENPHDKLPPSLSAMIITSHVKEGVEMAREARLPQEIIDFIPEHHGTTLVSYFYHMASKNGQSEYVLEEDFRYDGPKPRRKETAICMLADGCEASVRAMRQRGHLTHDQIEQQVKRIIEDRLKQGQLDTCDLTLKELDVIARTFVKVLSGVHHARIDYPTEVKGGGAAAPVAEPPGEEAQPEGAPVEAAQTKEATPLESEVEEATAHGDLDKQRTGQGDPDGIA